MRIRQPGTPNLLDSMNAPWWERLGLSLLLIGGSAWGFLYIDDLLASRSPEPVPLALGVDAYIPFVPSFIFAYVLYYPFLLLPAPVLRKRADFYSAFVAFSLMQVCAAVTFVLVPSRMERPEVTGEGLAADLVRWVYSLDQGWNVLPSLHVGHSVLVALIYWSYGRRWFVPVALGTVLICVSTVLVKQHYLVDIPAGAALAWVLYRLLGMQRDGLGRRHDAVAAHASSR